ncbi:hypothetical protein [Sphingorhabdus sp. Alg239-R122]|uniref:hypothetical protein n=1 Tax=Sphingorhabdus sp. Alg239-R122 TaxID=2305989 RepID=UPI001F087553|nr:hypothetical protein [Sphingorhabdus sp. Alg239-R122]
MIYKYIRNSFIASLCCFPLIFCTPLAHAQGSFARADYVALTKLSTTAPLVARVRVKDSIPLPAERAPGIPPDKVRLYIEAEVISLIRGRSGIGESIRYLVDVPRSDRGKAPKYKKREFLIFAKPVRGRPGEIQLVGKNAHMAWTPDTEQRTKNILREIVSPDAPPDITGIREALHVPGNLQGEGETQIFLKTESGAPASITILRRPGIVPQWAVSLTEILDESARIPERNTLLWYKLACFLPEKLPSESLISDNARANALARTDYQFVRRQLGPCGS